MKSIALAAILALSLLSFPVSHTTAAQTEGPSASGAYRFIMEEDGLIKYVEFDASTSRGVTTGRMIFTDQAKIPDGNEEEGSGDSFEFYMVAELDSLTVEKNRAIMGGYVRESSHKSYFGRWVQLVVEDNALNREIPDQLTWAFCQPMPGGWVPSDAEVPGDNGAWLSWWATDAERKDDVGIPSKSRMPGEMKGCEIYTIWSYAFADLIKWEGDIIVRS
jgi:hypothetical protein